MTPWLGLVAGALCAGAIACGAASPHASRAAAPTQAGAIDAADPRAEIDALDRLIDDELAKLNLARPAIPPAACIDPPCAGPTLMSTSVKPSTADPDCKPGTSETCTGSCELADSICVASERICALAADLGGSDRYANEKCASGKASCAAAHARCCGCQP